MGVCRFDLKIISKSLVSLLRELEVSGNHKKTTLKTMTIDLILLHTTTQTSQSNVTVWTVIATIAALISAFSVFRSRGYTKRTFTII